MFKTETKIGYSLALLDIAKEEKKIKEFYNQTSLLISSLEDQPDFEKILDSYKITSLEKESIIDKTFKEIHWSFINVMKILASKNQFRYFDDILKNLMKHLQELLNVKSGIVYSTYPLSATQIKNLEQKLEKQYESKIYLKNLIDKELIGGFRIEVGSNVIEDSIKYELELISKTLKEKGKKGGV